VMDARPTRLAVEALERSGEAGTVSRARSGGEIDEPGTKKILNLL